MPDKDKSSRLLETLKEDAGKEPRGADDTSKFISDQLKAFKGSFGEEASSNIREANEVRHMGWLGKFWGGKNEKAGNIAGIAVLFSFVLLSGVIILISVFNKISNSNAAILRDAFTVVVSVLTLSLGYLFGQGNNNKGR